MSTAPKGGYGVLDSRALMRAKLQDSGLDLEDALQLGYRDLSAAETQTLKLKAWKGKLIISMAIPYRSPFGDDWHFCRYRWLELPPSEKTNPEWDDVKYVQPKGSPVHVYFPHLKGTNWKKIIADVKQPLVITEGELKAACSTKRGFPTLGIGGVWNFMRRRKSPDISPDLSRIALKDRTVYIVYDSDASDNDQVKLAQQKFANQLIVLGADVRLLILPALGATKTGLDDYLCAAGDDAFKTLLETAEVAKIEWQVFYQMGANGPVNNLANAVVAFQNAEELSGIFKFDEMRLSVVATEPLFGLGIAPRMVMDGDVVAIQEWLQREGSLLRIGKDAVQDALVNQARVKSFHPVRDYLHSLRWDKKKRLDSWLHFAFGAAKNEYTTMVGRMFLVAMVARVMQPGCQADYMLVLEGEQGIAKSSACRVLAGEWFSDGLPDLHSDAVRLSMHLRGKWLIEMSELGGIKKAEVEDIKKFITRRIEEYIPKFGRFEAYEPRQCMFVGTTNESDYLKDETGNRRFWPIAVESVNLEWLRANRDQLFAEALALYDREKDLPRKPDESGPWWPSRADEDRLFKPEQDARFSGGQWDSIIKEYYDMWLPAVDDVAAFRVTSSEVLVNALNFHNKDLGDQRAKQVSGSMRRLGWERKKVHGERKWAPSKEIVDRITILKHKR